MFGVEAHFSTSECSSNDSEGGGAIHRNSGAMKVSMAGSKKYPEGKNERDIMDKVFCSASQPMGDGEKRGTLEEGSEKGIQYNEGQYFSKAKG